LNPHGDTAAYCRDYPSLGGLHGTDPATLQRAADLFRKLANEAPTSQLNAELSLASGAELEVKDGHAASVDNSAVEAALNRAGDTTSKLCG
jgi:hypothetical protein